VKRVSRLLGLAALLLPLAGNAQAPANQAAGPPMKTTFVRLTNNSNAILVEPVTPDPVRSHIAVVVTHPERLNNFGYFTGQGLAKYGYRALMVNYYGQEITYEEFLPVIAAAIKSLRATPGVDKVVLVGHSTGGPEFAFYQDVAENGPKACQEPARALKCDAKGLDNLPKADGFVSFDSHSGAPDRTIAFDPAVVDPHKPSNQRIAALDMFSPKNGYDPKTNTARYSEAFKKRFLAAQAARVNQLVDEAEARLKRIQAGKDVYKDDAPFLIYGGSRAVNGARLDQADDRLLSQTHAPRLLLKGDGTRSVEIVHRLFPAIATPQDLHQLDTNASTTMNGTVKHFLSFWGQKTKPGYTVTASGIEGVEWRGAPSSLQGSVEGIRVPTLVVSATCGPHLVVGEITYDHAAARDKDYVAVEGATHGFTPCKPQYGDTSKRAFDYLDGWLTKPGRFLPAG
jgi:pimeloyl-ACP methyl ester carboxylesterase